MGQYIVDVIAVVIAGLIIFRCARKGFFLTVLNFFKFLLSVLAAYFFGGKLGALIGNAFVNQTVYDSIYKKFNEIYQSAAGAFRADSVLDAIPSFLQTDEMMQSLNGLEGSGAELVESMARTVSEALSAAICTVVGSILMFLIAMLVLTVVCAIIKAIRSKIKLLGFADGLLGAVLGCLIACCVLMLFGSLIKLFFATSDVYNASKLVKFFGDATVGDLFGWLNIGSWVDKITSAL